MLHSFLVLNILLKIITIFFINFSDVLSVPNEKNISNTFYEKYGNTTEYGLLIYGVIFSSNLSYTLRPLSKSMATDIVFPVFSTPGPGTTYSM